MNASNDTYYGKDFGCSVATNVPPKCISLPGLIERLGKLVAESSENMVRASALADRLSGAVPMPICRDPEKAAANTIVSDLRYKMDALQGIVSATMGHLSRLEAVIHE